MSVLPPLLAITLAIITRQVILSLSVGIWIGFCLLESVNPLAGIGLALDGIVNVFSDAGDTRVLMFTLIIGGLIATIEKLGGVRGFIHLLEHRNWVTNGKRAQWLAYSIGIVVFIESNITLLIAGLVNNNLDTSRLNSLYNPLNGTFPEIIRALFHYQSINTDDCGV